MGFFWVWKTIYFQGKQFIFSSYFYSVNFDLQKSKILDLMTVFLLFHLLKLIILLTALSSKFQNEKVMCCKAAETFINGSLSLSWLALLHYFDRGLFEELLQNKLALWPIVRFSYFYTATLSLSLSISSPTITHTQTRILKFQQWPADSKVSIVKSFYMCVSVRVVCVLFLLFNV